MDDLLTPDQIIDAYGSGFVGAICDPDATARLLKELPMPFFGNALSGSGEGKLALPYKAVVKFEITTGRIPYDEAQRTGDCVSHAVRNACDLARANDPDLQSTEDWVDRTATEPIYGARGHSGQGALCSELVRWVSKIGGLMLRKRYPDLSIDLASYNPDVGIRWGGRGVPESVRAMASRHQVQTISLIQSWQQARDCLANGYGIAVCSDVGFRHTRNQEGVSTPQGSWAHAMAWTAVDDTRSGDCRFLVQNSWGHNWISGPRVHDQPEGSFWITQGVAQRMLAQGGAWAVSNVNGFPRRELKDWGAREVLG